MSRDEPAEITAASQPGERLGGGRPLRVAVIGGGLTGLAAAHRLLELASSRPHVACQITLIEAGRATGGVIGSERIGDYVVDLGADSFITNKPAGISLCRRLGLEDELITTESTHRRSLVLRNGKPVVVPEGFLLLSPTKIWPIVTSPIFSLLGKLRMACELVLPRRRSTEDESLASFVRRRLGRQALERLIQPLVGGIYTSDPEDLSMSATLARFVNMEREHRSLILGSLLGRGGATSGGTSGGGTTGSGARYGLFASLRGGMGDLLSRLEQRVRPHVEIRTGTAVRQISPREHGRETLPADGSKAGLEALPVGSILSSTAPLAAHDAATSWRVEFAEGDAMTYDAVIVATRAYQAGEMVAEFDPVLSEELCGIRYASTAIVVSGHRLEDVEHPLDAFGLVVPAIEKRRILAVSFSSRKFRGRAPDGRVILRTFVGGAMQPELFALDDEEILRIVREELSSILGVKSGREEFVRIARYSNAMPQYHVGHLDRVARIARRMSLHVGLELAGNAYHGVGVPDCIASGEQAAERVMDRLHARR